MPKDRLVFARNHRESEEILDIAVTNSIDGKDSTELLSSPSRLRLGQRSADRAEHSH